MPVFHSSIFIPNMKIVIADKDNIDTVRHLANVIWHDAYKNILSKQQLHYMLNKFYSKHSLEQQFDERHVFLLAVVKEKVVGYASYSLIDNNRNYKLHKLYVLPEQQKSGAGKALLTEVIKRVNDERGKSLLLNENRNNGALSFYQRMGFAILREEDIDIGEGYYMNDYVMDLPIN